MQKKALTITLNKIIEEDICEELNFEGLLAAQGDRETYDTPITLFTIAKVADFRGMICFLAVVMAQRDERLLCLELVEGILEVFEGAYPLDKRPEQAIQAAKDYYSEGKISIGELREYSDAAQSARIEANAVKPYISSAAYAAEAIELATVDSPFVDLKDVSCALLEAAERVVYKTPEKVSLEALEAAYFAERKRQCALILKFLERKRRGK